MIYGKTEIKKPYKVWELEVGKIYESEGMIYRLTSRGHRRLEFCSYHDSNWYLSCEQYNEICGWVFYLKDEPKEMTVGEVSEALGYEVKIVRE